MTFYFIAFLAGLLTLFSPCILPVLPFVFARSGKPFTQGGLPMLTGMAVTFTSVASLGAVASHWAVQLNQVGRWLALACLMLFAASLVFPRLATWLSQPLVRAGSQLTSTPSTRSIWGSFLLGVGTGLIWSPCAGPILGLVLSGAALAGPGVASSLLLLAYAAGAATGLGLALRALKRGGRVFAALRSRQAPGGVATRLAGVAMLVGTVAVAAGWDTGFLARSLPAANGGIEARLLQATMPSAHAAELPSLPSGLPVESVRPKLDGATAWLNTEPLSMASLRGKVVLVNFWTYSCVNCLRTLPYVRAWAQKYADQGLVVLGVHTPEFAFEKDKGNVQRALQDLKISYPVAQDNDFKIWRAFDNQYWPALYFVDAQGRVRHHQFGEGGFAQSERVIQALLKEAGTSAATGKVVADITAHIPPDTQGVGMAADTAHLRSPETYLGYEKGSGLRTQGGPALDRVKSYQPGPLSDNEWSLGGEWTVRSEFAESMRADATLALRFHARDVNLVLGGASAKAPIRFRITLNGKPPGADHGTDVDANGYGLIEANRLYQLIRQTGRIDSSTVEIQFLAPGARAYAFTFG